MNDKCAAGTGRFLEVMARVLDCPIASLSQLAQQGEEVVPISNLCTVFAESEVISHLSARPFYCKKDGEMIDGPGGYPIYWSYIKSCCGRAV